MSVSFPGVLARTFPEVLILIIVMTLTSKCLQPMQNMHTSGALNITVSEHAGPVAARQWSLCWPLTYSSTTSDIMEFEVPHIFKSVTI